MENRGKALIIYGPTVTGKTNLAISLAQKLNGELISADSRQVYKGLDIGTGKVSFDSEVEKHSGYWIVDGVKIRGFDLIKPPVFEPGSKKYYEPGSGPETFTAADFLKFAHSSMIQIIELNKLPIVVGGTGFYIKALIDGIDSIGIPKDEKLRRQLEKLTIGQLYQKLLGLDKTRAKAMNDSDRANPRRLIRAIEIAKDSLTPGVSKVASEHTPGVSLVVGQTAPNEYLYRRADKWLETRLKKGMIDEVRDLIKNGTDPIWLESLGLEYRWLTRFILGKITQEKALERLRGDIHSLIRRQKTWFKQFKTILLFDISQPGWSHQLEKTVKDWYNEAQ